MATFTQQVEQINADVMIVLLTSVHAIMKTCYNLLKFTIYICPLRVNGFDHVSLTVKNHDTHGVILSTPHRYTKEKRKNKNKNKEKKQKKPYMYIFRIDSSFHNIIFGRHKNINYPC